MYVTTEEAKKLWCPMVRWIQHSSGIISNRGANYDPSTCLGDGCMLWVFWGRQAGIVEQKGYCGLIEN